MTAFIITCMLIELTPGPNMAYLAILSLSAGRVAGFVTVVGIALGLGCVAMVSALGMAELINQYPLLYQLIRWAGVIYLLWLALLGWRESREVSPAKVVSLNDHCKYLLQGFVVNILNPKAAVFYLAVLPGFLQPDAPLFSQTVILVSISICIATAVHLLIVLGASYFRPALEKPNQM